MCEKCLVAMLVDHRLVRPLRLHLLVSPNFPHL